MAPLTVVVVCQNCKAVVTVTQHTGEDGCTLYGIEGHPPDCEKLQFLMTCHNPRKLGVITSDT